MMLRYEEEQLEKKRLLEWRSKSLEMVDFRKASYHVHQNMLV